MARQYAVGIDPGLRACGVGLVDCIGAELVRAWLVKSPELDDDGAKAWEAMARAVGLELGAEMQRQSERWGAASVYVLAIERQAIRGDPKRGLVTRNPGQILGLAHVAGALTMAVYARQKLAVWPQTWNGNLPKDKSTERVWASLSERERRVVEGAHLKSTGHNVIDSAGIAKWAARHSRLQPSRG